MPDLELTSFYGIREYSEDAWLRGHIDRIDTHVLSVTISIQKLDEEGNDLKVGDRDPWPLQGIGYDGKVMRYDHPAGTMVLYESSKIVDSFDLNAASSLMRQFSHFWCNSYTASCRCFVNNCACCFVGNIRGEVVVPSVKRLRTNRQLQLQLYSNTNCHYHCERTLTGKVVHGRPYRNKSGRHVAAFCHFKPTHSDKQMEDWGAVLKKASVGEGVCVCG